MKITKDRDLLQVSDEDELVKLVKVVLDKNTKAVQDLKSGQDKVMGFLVGQVMKESKRQANPGLAKATYFKGTRIMTHNQPVKSGHAAAGFGTRFLLANKSHAKEMLPIIDKPVIQMIVEEAVQAGVTEIIIVTGSTKRAIEDHFDRAVELEDELIAKG